MAYGGERFEENAGSRGFIRVNCTECAFSDSYEPADSFPRYCPECGGSTGVSREFKEEDT